MFGVTTEEGNRYAVIATTAAEACEALSTALHIPVDTLTAEPLDAVLASQYRGIAELGTI